MRLPLAFLLCLLFVVSLSKNYLRSIYHPKAPAVKIVLRKDITGALVNKSNVAEFPSTFQWGIATAPAHVEDQLDDAWLDWALAGKIPWTGEGFQTERRLDFWSNPETDIKLAASTNVKVFRMGVDWGRLAPFFPGSLNCDINGHVTRESGDKYPCADGVQDVVAMKRYVSIFEMVRSYNMIIALTLFHHSLPKYYNKPSFGGWTNSEIIPYFVAFTKDVVSQSAHLVDRYIVLNENAVFANLVYAAGMWPGRLYPGASYLALLNLGRFYKGNVHVAYKNFADAYNQCYDLIHELDTIVADVEDDVYKGAAYVGIAHNVAYYIGANGYKLFAKFAYRLLNILFFELVADKMDFIGLNYYGKEYNTLSGSKLYSHIEYSESGRAISPKGLYNLVHDFNQRFNVKMNRSIPFWITENGISDSTDILRPSFMIEHLMVVQKLINEGIKFDGFIFWTISDNWEWMDGFCPRFGAWSVDRSSENLERTERPSAEVFRQIVAFNSISRKQRSDAWQLVQSNARFKLSDYKNIKSPIVQPGDEELVKTENPNVISLHGIRMRPFCRNSNGAGTVTESSWRRFVPEDDWRFPYRLK